MNTRVHLWYYLDKYFLEWEKFQTKLYRKSKDTFYVQQPFPESRAVYETMWKNTAEPERGHRWQYIMAQALLMLDK
jgi:hypothetical protein